MYSTIQRQNLQKLIGELSSGKYKKGTNCLRSKRNCYCCMGVAADILDCHGWINVGDVYKHKLGAGLDQYQALSNKALLDFGLSANQQSVLMTLNDNNDTFESVINKLKEYLDEGL